MMRAQVLLAALLSGLIALLLWLLVLWLTSGTWSPQRVSFFELVLVAPMLIALELGLPRSAAAAACFVSYWLIAFVLLLDYIRSAGLRTRAPRATSSKL